MAVTERKRCPECGGTIGSTDKIDEVLDEIGEDTFFEWSVVRRGEGHHVYLLLHYDFFGGPEPEERWFHAQKVADELGISVEEVVERAEAGGRRLVDDGEKTAKEPEITVGGMQIGPVSLEELGVEPDQGTASRMTIRNLDRTILEVVKARLGAESDAEAVRKALTVAGQVLVKE
jgi:hypothetical protein